VSGEAHECGNSATLFTSYLESFLRRIKKEEMLIAVAPLYASDSIRFTGISKSTTE
jgi:hypothetical protein